MNIRQANARARKLFGADARCETTRRGQTYERTLTIKANGRMGSVSDVAVNFPARIPWEHIFDFAKGLVVTTRPEGT